MESKKIETFTPIRGVYSCVNETGNYVKKSDYDNLLSTHIPVDKAVEAFKIACDAHDDISGWCFEYSRACKTDCIQGRRFLSALGVNDKKEG